MANQLNNLGSQGVVYLEIREAALQNIHIAALEDNLQRDINIAVLAYLDRQISLLQAAYATRSDDIYKCLTIYVTIQGALLAALFCYAQQMKAGPTGCGQEWWTTVPLILLAIASVSLIYAMLRQFVGQFHLLKRGRQFQEDRSNFLVAQHGITLTIGNRFFLINYNRESVVCHEEEEEDHINSEKYNHITWWAAERIVFLGFLMAFSICLLLSCTRLLCSQPFHN